MKVKSYKVHRHLLAGGNWNNSTSCSSRCRNGNNVRSNVNANNGAREVIWGAVLKTSKKKLPKGSNSI